MKLLYLRLKGFIDVKKGIRVDENARLWDKIQTSVQLTNEEIKETVLEKADVFEDLPGETVLRG